MGAGSDRGLLRGRRRRRLGEALEAGDAAYENVYLNEDAQEGPLAFKEKRAPVWKAR